MCLITFNWQNHPQYKLIVVANRDEFYKRKTQAAHFWQEDEQLLAGKDLEAGGTWLGIHQKGRFSALTNYRDLANLKSVAPSRGQLTSDFLLNEHLLPDYLQTIAPKAAEYNGYNLLVGNLLQNELYYFSNYQNQIQALSAGLYGLSNHLLDTNWYKVRQAKAKLAQAIQKPHISAIDLLDLMHDSIIPPDEQVQQTGLSMDKERMLSAMFIQSPDYGTCSTAVVLVDWQNKVEFWERLYNTPDNTIQEQNYTFQLKI
jgi:uncharacterized protein with NRDE domain